jgi:release factor glutamine methyltransferase
MASIKTIIGEISKQLAENSIPNPHMEARIIVSHYLNSSIEELIINQDRQCDYNEALSSLVQQRLLGKPLAYILGYKEFYGRKFLVNQDVLIPRPDTEILIDAVLKKYIDCSTDQIDILELGVGSGCIITTLALELRNSKGIGLDISSEALNIAMQNLQYHNCQDRILLLASDWYSEVPIENKFDIIISNPPYIPRSEKDLMSKETIEYEPELALYSESHNTYKIIAKYGKHYLEDKGRIYIEIGINQESAIIEIFTDENYILEECFYDLNHIMRVLVFRVKN